MKTREKGKKKFSNHPLYSTNIGIYTFAYSLPLSDINLRLLPHQPQVGSQKQMVFFPEFLWIFTDMFNASSKDAAP